MDSNMSVLLHLDVEPLRRCAWCKGPFTPSVRFNKSNFHFLENRWFACWPMWVCVQVGRSFPLRKLFMGYAWNWINFAFRNCPFFIPEPRDTFRDVVNSLATSNDSQKKQKAPMCVIMCDHRGFLGWILQNSCGVCATEHNSLTLI